MTLGFPTASEILDGVVSSAQSILPSLNSGLRNSAHRAILVGFSQASFEQYLQLQIVLNQMFIDTAQQDFLEIYGRYKSITRNPASQAQGFITVSGVDSTFVPLGTTFSSPDNQQYTTLSDKTIVDSTLSITSITRISNIATVTTVSDHNLASGVSVTISGADQTEYNGTFDITVTGADEFTYNVTGTPVTPATGTLLSAFTTASVEVQSVNTGQDTNQVSGVGLTVDTPIAGMNDTGFVQFGELGGGSPIETDDELRSRILEAYQNPISNFNVAQIVAQAKLVTGVTRVFVQEITPDVGQVTVYFTRDNDDDIIPSLSEVDAVKDKLKEIASAFFDKENDLIVLAPEPFTINFTFSSTTPNTPTIQQAIVDNLDLFFRTKTEVGANLEEVDYLSVINDTVDTNTGSPLESFVLDSPTGDIMVSDNQIPVLGAVNF
jgi:uncharacterized phage protein gp47/JayE